MCVTTKYAIKSCLKSCKPHRNHVTLFHIVSNNHYSYNLYHQLQILLSTGYQGTGRILRSDADYPATCDFNFKITFYNFNDTYTILRNNRCCSIWCDGTALTL